MHAVCRKVVKVEVLREEAVVGTQILESIHNLKIQMDEIGMEYYTQNVGYGTYKYIILQIH